MASVTGITAERAEEIEAASIVGGEVVGDDLILARHDGGLINAGSVRGPQGDEGPAGDVSLATMNAADAAVQAEMDTRGLGDIVEIELNADESWALVEGTWQVVTGGSFTFTPVPGRRYRFELCLTMESYEAGVDMHAILDPSVGKEIFRLSAYSPTANRMCGMSAVRTVTAPAGWNVPINFVTRVWFATDFEVRIKSGTYPFALTVRDVGLPPS